MKKIIKRIFCKHEYMQDVRFFGKHAQTRKDIIFYYKFKCFKCEKVIKILMNEKYQIEQTTGGN